MYMLNIFDKMSEMSEKFKEWMISNQDNVFLWVGLFFGGLIILFIGINYFNKDN